MGISMMITFGGIIYLGTEPRRIYLSAPIEAEAPAILEPCIFRTLLPVHAGLRIAPSLIRGLAMLSSSRKVYPCSVRQCFIFSELVGVRSSLVAVCCATHLVRSAVSHRCIFLL